MPKDYSKFLEKSTQKTASKNQFDIVATLIKYKEQLKICHWQTTSYAQHMAFDRINGEINDLLDGLVEVMNGKYGKFTIDGGASIGLVNFSELNLADMNNSMVDFLTNIFPTYVDIQKDTELLNIRDEILAQVNELKYLLTLN